MWRLIIAFCTPIYESMLRNYSSNEFVLSSQNNRNHQIVPESAANSDVDAVFFNILSAAAAGQRRSSLQFIREKSFHDTGTGVSVPPTGSFVDASSVAATAGDNDSTHRMLNQRNTTSRVLPFLSEKETFKYTSFPENIDSEAYLYSNASPIPSFRRSQPSLISQSLRSAGGVYGAPASQIRHAPSHPALSASVHRNGFVLVAGAQQQPNRNCCAAVPQENVSRTHFYTSNGCGRGSMSGNTLTKGPPNGNAVPRRSLANARATEKRILKRCPQSDLSYRFQRLNNNNMNEIGVARCIPSVSTNQPCLNFQRFESVGPSGSNESTPSRSEGQLLFVFQNNFCYCCCRARNRSHLFGAEASDWKIRRMYGGRQRLCIRVGQSTRLRRPQLRLCPYRHRRCVGWHGRRGRGVVVDAVAAQPVADFATGFRLCGSIVPPVGGDGTTASKHG